jgi:hypothetical protein
MTGTNQLVKVTLRNPLDYDDRITYNIIPHDNILARDWIVALKELLQAGNLLEKNYCFMGFPTTARNLDYLCNQLNQHIRQINNFNSTGVWERAGLESYVIEDWFNADIVRFGNEYSLGVGPTKHLGLRVKHSMMNRLHNHFERLQGTVWNLSEYYRLADYATKYAIRQLNNLCHEVETLILSQRKLVTEPDWVRPSQITTFLHAQRYDLRDDHRELFNINGYDRQFAHVYMHWTQIGKTLFEVFRDEHAPELTDTVCEAITELKYYSGEFDIEWGNDVVYGGAQPWHTAEQDQFREWLIKNNRDPQNTRLSLGYLPIGYIDLQSSFATDDPIKVREILGNYLDIYSIEVDGIVGTFDYCWNDSDYAEQQINRMIPGYDYSSRG